MNIVRRLEKEIQSELILIMQSNPVELAVKLARRSPEHPLTIQCAKEIAAKQQQELRRAAFIYGDSYHGQPMKQFVKLMGKEGFVDKHPKHEYFDITIHHSFDGEKLNSARLTGKLHIGEMPDSMLASMVSGLGINNACYKNGFFEFDLDCTWGFRMKMEVLRQLATDHSECLNV